MLYERYCELHAKGIHLYFCPFFGASFEAKFPIRQCDADVLNSTLRDGIAETDRLMGIPVIMSNKVGRLVTNVPARFPPQDIEFPGCSAIDDSNGTLIASWVRAREALSLVSSRLTQNAGSELKSSAKARSPSS